MVKITEIKVPGYEKVIEGIDPHAGLHCFIAVHNTDLGPSLGGTRIYPYKNKESALQDALRLSKAMTYKSALVETGLGGGKGVIIADPSKDKSEALLLAYAEVINHLEGLYIAAEDVGTTADDIAIVSRGTRYVAALPHEKSSGDPSRFTAWGVFLGIQAVAETLWGSKDLHGKRIAIQGIGNVGEKLARLLFWHGAELLIADIAEEKVKNMAVRYGGTIIDTQTFAEANCDILCPCALGGIINAESVSKLNCQAIAGSANNQLEHSDLADILKVKEILYAPDYVINAGGVINAASEFEQEGYDPKRSRDKVENIYATLKTIFKEAKESDQSTSAVADALAEYKLTNQIGRRTKPMRFPLG